MINLILQLMVSLGDYEYTSFEKHVKQHFIPTPGMEIKFGNKSVLQGMFVQGNEDFPPKWDMEKNTVTVFIGDWNSREEENYKRIVSGFKKDGWKIYDQM